MLTLTRDEFEDLIKDQIELVEDAVLNAIDKSELEASKIERVLMVGGSSRIPVFQEMVKRITGVSPELTKNLDEDVSRGASMLGAKLGGQLDPRSQLAQLPKPVDAASHALGINVVDEQGRLYNEVVIQEGTPLPHKFSTNQFSTATEGQAMIELVLNEGADRDLDFVRTLDRSTGNFPAPVERGHPLRCDIEYTAEQLINVQMFDGVSGQFLCNVEVKHDGNLSDEEKSAARDLLQTAEIR